MPYLDLHDPTRAAPDLELRVTGATEFVSVVGFTFEDPDQDDRRVDVPDGLPTDLASVPFFLQWLVRSYGKHTRGALLHDTYWGWARTGADVRDINRLFRDAMRDSGTPLVRRWFVWGAVSMAGLAKLGVAGVARLVAWAIALAVIGAAVVAGAHLTIALGPALIVAAGLAGLALVAGALGWSGGDGSARRGVSWQVAGISAAYAALVALAVPLSRGSGVRHHWALIAVVALAMAVAMAWPTFGAGFIAAVTVLVVLIPTTAVFAALAVYGSAELVAYAVRWVLHSATGARPPAPPASTSLRRPAASS